MLSPPPVIIAKVPSQVSLAAQEKTKKKATKTRDNKPTSFEFDNKQHYLNVNGNTTGTAVQTEDVTRAPLGG